MLSILITTENTEINWIIFKKLLLKFKLGKENLLADKICWITFLYFLLKKGPGTRTVFKETHIDKVHFFFVVHVLDLQAPLVHEEVETRIFLHQELVWKKLQKMLYLTEVSWFLRKSTKPWISEVSLNDANTEDARGVVLKKKWGAKLRSGGTLDTRLY